MGSFIKYITDRTSPGREEILPGDAFLIESEDQFVAVTSATVATVPFTVTV